MMAMGTIGAFAATGINDKAADSQKETGALNVVKEVQYPDGTTHEAKTFTVNVTPITAEQAEEKDIDANIEINFPALTEGAAGEGSVNKVTQAVEKQIVDAFASAATGKYVYVIKEDQAGEKAADEKYGWTMSDSEYLLQVFKLADGSVTYTIYSYDKETKLSNEITKSEDGTITYYEGAAAFVNTFTKRAGDEVTPPTDPDPENPPVDVDGDGNTDSLVITKTVTGGDLPEGTEFEYTITFTLSELDKAESYTAARIGTGTEEETVTFAKDENGHISGTFYLAGGESLVFNDIMAGTYYTITEKGKTDVAPSAAVVANGQTVENGYSAGKAADLTIPSTLIGENANRADFTNDVTDITITGLALQAAPYAALIGFGFIMMAAYVMMRRRSESR